MRLPNVDIALAVALIAGVSLAYAAPAVPSAAPAAQKAAPASKAVSIVELDVITVLALSQADNRAVIGLPDKQMVVVKNGDPLPRTRAVLTQVLPDKLVLEEKSADGKTKQLVWMHKGQGGTPGRIERFATEAAPTVVAAAPVRTVVPVKSPATPVRKP
jgi:hypothetical protein